MELLMPLDWHRCLAGRETALPQMLQMHPSLRSLGIIEKPPQTRSEKTYWLDTRAKEAIGKAILNSKGKLMYLQVRSPTCVHRPRRSCARLASRAAATTGSVLHAFVSPHSTLLVLVSSATSSS